MLPQTIISFSRRPMVSRVHNRRLHAAWFRLRSVRNNDPWNGNFMEYQPARGMGWSSLVFSLITKNYICKFIIKIHEPLSTTLTKHFPPPTTINIDKWNGWFTRTLLKRAGTHLCLAIFHISAAANDAPWHGSKDFRQHQLGTKTHARHSGNLNPWFAINQRSRQSVGGLPMFAPFVSLIYHGTPKNMTQTTRYH